MSDKNHSSDYSSSSDSEISTSSDENESNSNNLQLYGDIVGKYNIISELGRGSYSIVWLAFNIEDSKYYAVKIHNPEDFKEGLEELNIMKKLPKNVKYFNHLKEHFIHTVVKNDKKKDRFLCSVYDLHCGNIDCFIRKGEYKKGFTVSQAKKIFHDLIKGLNILHDKVKVFHGDIKSDNILLKGLNKRDKKLIELYNKREFLKKYSDKKKEFWLNKGRNLDKLKKMKKNDKEDIRRRVHFNIVVDMMKEFNENYDDKIKYLFDDKYIETPEIVIADFGDFCDEDEKFDEVFGTRYYRSPEGILLSECDSKVDIWAAGCCLYEFLTGEILFDPKKDKERDRDFYHLLEIQKLCGRFQKRFLKETEFWKEHFDKKGNLKKIKNSDDLEKINWEDKLSNINIEKNDLDLVIDLLKKIFVINPDKRISSSEILNHDLFKGI